MHSATIYFNILKFLITALAGRKFGFTDKFVQVKAEIQQECDQYGFALYRNIL